MPQQYVTTLGEMRGFVRRLKPNVDPNTIRDFLNQRVRSLLDRSIVWSGLIRRGVIQIPAAYSTGTVTLTSGSAVVAGAATDWPVSDIVNTTLSAAVDETGLQWVTPASMTGIDVDTVLVADAGSSRELVAVVETDSTRFRANFRKTHLTSATLTASSLTGRQFKLGMRYPIYTVRAVYSATSMELDNPWAGDSLPSIGYTVLKAYYTMSPNMKHLLTVLDPQQAIALKIHYPQSALNVEDPQRTAAGWPTLVSDVGRNEAGNMQYEIYPHQTAPRHLSYIYVEQWPDMKEDGDQPPPFVNPNVFLWGAASQALRTKVGEKDSYYDPATANYYEAKAMNEEALAMAADQSKAQTMLSLEVERMLGGRGGLWNQSHAVTAGESYGSFWP